MAVFYGVILSSCCLGRATHLSTMDTFFLRTFVSCYCALLMYLSLTRWLKNVMVFLMQCFGDLKIHWPSFAIVLISKLSTANMIWVWSVVYGLCILSYIPSVPLNLSCNSPYVISNLHPKFLCFQLM
uniref:Uncharacterized protein n=1 Tax=Opuntia streptacantha TaxID=393608 RepID=A0A7C9DP49_OPUST